MDPEKKSVEPLLFVAAKAFIQYDRKVLIIREATTNPDGTNEGTYDVPGGRLESNESVSEGLLREVREETGLSIRPGKPFFVSEWRPVVRGEQWHIIAIFFACESATNIVSLNPEHDTYKWIETESFGRYPIISNLGPVFEEFIKFRTK